MKIPRWTSSSTSARTKATTVGAALVVVGSTLGAPGHAAATPAEGVPARVAASPTDTDGNPRGEWRIDPRPQGGVRVSWASATPLPVTSDQPQILLDGLPLGTTRVSADRLRVAVTGTVATAPSIGRLDLALSGRLLDEPPPAARPSDAIGQAVPDAPLLSTDPAEPGPFEVSQSDYQRQSISIGTMRDVEVVARVIGPVDAPGPRPVVVFLHGQHDWCYVPDDPDSRLDTTPWPCAASTAPVPNHHGYEYVQRVLASQGFLTLSISANGVNAQDEVADRTSAAARGQLIRHHLDLLATSPQELGLPATPDLEKVVLVGHSRGGAGAARASLTVPLNAPYRIVGQVLIAPTNINRQTTPHVPTVTLLGYCDGDVWDLEGQLYTDLARDVTTDDTATHSTVLVMGANHNFFNTEWTPGLASAPAIDDRGDQSGYCSPGSPTRLRAGEQRTVASGYVVGATRYFTGDSEFWPLFDGSDTRLPTAQSWDVRTHTVGGGRVTVRPGIGSSATGEGLQARVCNGQQGPDPGDCLRTTLTDSHISPHFVHNREGDAPATPALELRWQAPGAAGGLDLAQPMDLTAAAYLDLRVLRPVGATSAGFDVRLVDSSGQSTTVTPLRGGQVAGVPRTLYGGVGIAQTLRVDLSEATGADLADVASILLVPRADSGRAWVLDAAGSPAAAPPPARLDPVPTLALQGTTVVEGDGPHSVAVPFTITGASEEPMTIRVSAPPDLYAGRAGPVPPFDPFDLTIPAGTTTGEFQVELVGNDVHDLNRRLPVAVYALRDVMTTRNLAMVRIADDDPRPGFRIRAADMTREGDTVRFEAGWAEPVGFDTYVEARYERAARGRPLRVGDVSRDFLRSWVAPEARNPGNVLAGRAYGYWASIRGSRGTTVFRLPVRRDDAREPDERVRLSVHSPRPYRLEVARTVAVRDAAR